MIPNVEDLTEPPIVGKFYMVPCIRTQTVDGELVNNTWWPVTGPRHEDTEFIGFSKQHRHYDIRFLNNDQMDKLCNRGRHRKISFFGPDPDQPDSEAHNNVTTSNMEPVRRRLKCKRTQPSYSAGGTSTPRWIAPLSEHLSDARIKCGKCPHRGLPLLSLPREPGTDIVQCVGHGLRFDLKTGKLVKGAPCSNT